MFFHELERVVRWAEEQFEKELAYLLRMFPHHHYHRKHGPKPHQVLLFIHHKQKFIVMDALILKPGKRAPIVPALIDAVTGLPVPGATFVAKSNTVDNNTVATVDADGKLAYVSDGTAKLTSVNTWTYQDQNTGDSITVDLTTIADVKALKPAEVVQQTIALGDQEDIPAVIA